jgi:uncharacterized membrane protein YfcA
MMVVTGYILGILIGICLGIMGAGGSILTIPVLVYLMGISPVMATTYSLFIVGITALIGSVGYIRNKNFSAKAVIFFGVPSVFSVFISSRYLLPAVPDVLCSWNGMVFTKSFAIMLLLGLLMLISSYAMFRSAGIEHKQELSGLKKIRYGLVTAEGIGLGMITGLLGAGGGFLIIPALVILERLPMKMAVGTSLMIIAINSAVGFSSKLWVSGPIDWPFLLAFSSLAVLGIFTGMYLSRFVTGARLKLSFAFFILLMGTIVMVREIYHL